MNKQEFNKAFKVADNGEPTGCNSADMAVLDGCGLRGFQPVSATVQLVAYWIRWQALQFNGKWDHEALNECAYIARKRITLIG